MNEIIADGKDKNNEIFSNYFKYRNPWFLGKDLISAKQNKNKKLVNNINNGSIDLRNNIKEKKFLKMEIRKKQPILLKKSSTLINNEKVKELKY